ncbi:cilia- and flagella-associated protein 418 [Lepeophtheirus salmonis]|uniref:cilia- and flagella-associated protein 418 n=1 Tax=Lepeophtheirus salmonis TaxID=72036 RepID=UPI003AF38CD0
MMEDIDDLLEELEDIDPFTPKNLDDILEDPSSKDRSNLLSNNIKRSRKRCSPTTYLGGSKFNFGWSSTDIQCCDRLFCLKCDFRVCIFGNHKWRSDTDYYFLRDFVPDYRRLKSRLLISNDGSNAYCCQCKWINVRELMDVETAILDSNWACVGH